MFVVKKSNVKKGNVSDSKHRKDKKNATNGSSR